MTQSQMLKLMYKYYKKDYASRTCQRCCNLHKHTKEDGIHKICIAFGDSDKYDCTWNENNKACGIYNTPFLGLPGKHVPLVQRFESQFESISGEQSSIFASDNNRRSKDDFFAE